MISLDIENLGPISKANISLRKNLTVLAGPNNAGKTYGSYTLYVGLQWLNELVGSSIHPGLMDYSKVKNTSEDGLSDLLKNILLEEINRQIKRRNRTAQEYILSEAFAVNSAIFKEANLSIKTDPIFLKSLLNNIIQETIETYKKLGESKPLTKTDEIEFILEDAIISIFRTIHRRRTSDTFVNAYFFPAERAAISLFSKELSLRRNVLIDELLKGSNKKKVKEEDILMMLRHNAKRYPRAITDALLHAENPPDRNEKSPFMQIATELESELLGNVISYNEDGQVVFKPIGSKSKEMPFQMASSVVKSLASFILYLKHTAQVGDVVFIDEPESNLHPDNQILISRYLARLSKKGLKVVISTHSDYVIRELNNLILLNGKSKELQKTIIKEHKVPPDSLLAIDDIEVYYFAERTVKTLEISQEFGFSIETIDKAIEDQNLLIDKLL